MSVIKWVEINKYAVFTNELFWMTDVKHRNVKLPKWIWYRSFVYFRGRCEWISRPLHHCRSFRFPSPATWPAPHVDAGLLISPAHLQRRQWWTYQTPADLKKQAHSGRRSKQNTTTLGRCDCQGSPYPTYDWLSIFFLAVRLVGFGLGLGLNQSE